MPRILVASYFQETNSFNPWPTTCDDFSVYEGEALFDAEIAEIDGARRVFAQHEDVELLPTYGVRMGAGGTITRACFERFTQECVDAMKKHRGSLDAVYLALHGAMAAESEPDPEGCLVEAVRELLGPHVPIVVSLDMHGTVSRRMLPNVDGISILQTYPHVDWFEMGARAAGQILHILDGARPVLACARIPIMVRGDELKTATGLFGAFVRYCQRLEMREDVLGAGIVLGHPFTDVPEQGAQVVVITDDDPQLAAVEAQTLAEEFWAMRRHMQCVLLSIDDAIEIARQTDGPVVFADAADATSSGASGDSNVILKALLEKGYAGSVLFPLRDAPAVHSAFMAGVGSRLTLPLGGTVDPQFSPVRLEVQVELLSSGRYYSADGRVKSAGRLAVLRAGNITIVATAEGAPLADYALFPGIGQEPRRFDLIVVKLPHTPHDQYEAWAAKILNVDTPGAASPNVKALNHRQVQRPIYPLDEDMTFTPQVELVARGQAIENQ